MFTPSFTLKRTIPCPYHYLLTVGGNTFNKYQPTLLRQSDTANQQPNATVDELVL